jgi:glycine/D-amino acid oxidase-like deaminating enzyme
MALSTEDGGKGLIAAHRRALQEAGVHTWFDCPAKKIITENGRVTGIEVEKDGRRISLTTNAVVLACGGYESSAELRRKHLGPGWEKAKVKPSMTACLKT